jgi:uncharacterized protein YndB with AHSA1/START domain
LTDNEPLVKEIYIKASPEKVFSFLSQHDKFLRWMGKALDIDARPGGIFRLDPNGKEIIRGKFLEVDPPYRIVFSWGFEVGDMDVPPGSTIVEITLTPDGDGTILRLTHRDLPREGEYPTPACSRLDSSPGPAAAMDCGSQVMPGFFRASPMRC